MKRLIGYVLLIAAFCFVGESAVAQLPKWRDMHRVKKKETVFGIARDYGLTIDELLDANPEMKTPGYELKKGDIIRIPYPKAESQNAGTTETKAEGKAETKPATAETKPATTKTKPAAAVPEASASGSNAPVPAAASDEDVRNRAIRLGVMLPLHDVNGDGRRMVEYYRGILMACDSLKKQGISIDVRAWNTVDGADIRPILKEKAAQECDLIIGPLYSKQMELLSDFVTKHDIRLVIPFSIDAPQLYTNRNIFQVYQSPTLLNEAIIQRFIERFKYAHPVIIDCNDSTSTKGDFTFRLRRTLESKGIEYSITNLKSSEGNFAKAFDPVKRNVVVLNTGRSQELSVAVAKLNGLTAAGGPQVTLFGYTDWLIYTKNQLENFYKFDVYIPSPYYLNPLSAEAGHFSDKYRSNFHADMMVATPRFAVTGFDHAFFFLKGLHKYGKTFNGAAGMFGYQPVQTPLKFERIGNGGLQNRALLFIHYLPEHRIETIKF